MSNLKDYLFYQDDWAKIYCGDCLEILPLLDPVDLVLTDPPYGTTQLDFDTETLDWVKIWPILIGITGQSTPILFFSAQPFTTDLIMSNRNYYRYEIIWEKSAGTGFLDANRRPLKFHENIEIFCREPGKSIYNPQKSKGSFRKNGGTGNRAKHYGKFNVCLKENDGKRYPKSVVFFENGHGDQTSFHPTEKPVPLLEYLINSYSNPKNAVLDFTCGSGSTLVAAKNLNRKSIGIEIEPKYCEIAVKRLRQEVFDFRGINGVESR